MFFVGILIGLVIVYFALKLGNYLGNKCYDKLDEHFKNRYSKK
jgi:hypothetical protein